MKKILFGAGLYGKLALEKYGKDNVEYFVDNNARLHNEMVNGIKVISFENLKKIYDSYEVIITTKYMNEIKQQLMSAGIKFQIYNECDERYYPTNELVVNPYEGRGYLDSTMGGINQKISETEMEIKKLYGANNLFNHIELETINRCNGNCSFCPVSVKNDVREKKEMSWELFVNIIDQLAEINYSGRLALFSNNEPFLDETIVDKHKYAREKCRNAKIHLFTNGTLLTLDKFKQIIEYVDELVIDNYNQKLELNKNSKEIVEYCEKEGLFNDKLTVVIRKQDEILTNRGGDAPNRKDVVTYPDAKCILPFKQMIIRPDGKVSLCCNDPIGKNTLADLTKESILDAWNNDRFKMVRKVLYEKGRGEWKHCEFCDVFNLG